MAITIKSSAVGAQNLAFASKYSWSRPAGLAVGDLAVLFISAQNSSSANPITTPAGWTLVDQRSAVQSGGSFYSIALVYTRILSGTNNDTTSGPFVTADAFATTGANASGITYYFASGTFDTTTPINGPGFLVQASGTLANSTLYTWPSTAVTRGGSLAFYLIAGTASNNFANSAGNGNPFTSGHGTFAGATGSILGSQGQTNAEWVSLSATATPSATTTETWTSGTSGWASNVAILTTLVVNAVNTAPTAPTVATVTPATARFNSGFTVTWTFNDVDTEPQASYSFRRVNNTTTTTEYWTGSAWTTSLTYVTTATTSVAFPAGMWPAGSYTFSVSTKDAAAATSPFSTTQTLTSVGGSTMML